MSVQDSSQLDPTVVAADAAGTELDDDVEAHGAKEWIAGLSTAVVLTGAGAGVAAASMSGSSAPRGTAHAAAGADVEASDTRVPDTGSSGVIDPFETLDNDIRNTLYKASKDAEDHVRGITHNEDDVATRTHLVATLPRSFAGQQITLTAKVTAEEVRTEGLTGQVTFTDGGRRLGSARISDQGVASFTTSELRAGPHVLRAVYQGDGMYNGSASDPVHQDVAKASTQTVVRSSMVRAASYMPVEFTAHVASGHPGAIASTGSVSFWHNDVRLGTAEVAPDGTATISTNELGTGPHDIIAQYTGDSRHAASESLPLPQLVVDPSGPLSG